MAHVLATMPVVTGASDAKKQELAENFLFQALLIDGSVAAAKKRPDLMPKAKANISAGTRATLGIDLNALKLTEKGLTL